MELQAVEGRADAHVSRVADEVRAELARQRRTAAEMAVVLGLTPQTVGRRLSGVKPFNIAELQRIAEWLDTPTSELIARAERAEQAEKKAAA